MQTSVSFLVLSLVLAGAMNAMAADEAVQKPQPTPLRAGFARTDLTPPVGAEIPGSLGKNPSTGIHDPLWAEAAFFSDDSVAIAVVGVDLILVTREMVEDARRQIEARCGMPGANVLIGASHTHNGGPVIDSFSVAADSGYCRMAAEHMADAVVRARETAVEARISVGSGHEDAVGFNRRFKMKDGSVKTHPGKMNPDIVEPAGPIDPEVAVIAVESIEGRPLGCIVNFALHGTTLGGSLISADWPCYLRQTVRGGIGADIGVVFLNGACGDVTQVDNRNARPAEFGEAWARRVGMTVGAEVLKVLAKAEYKPGASLAAASEILPLPIRNLAGSDGEVLAREAPAIGLGSGAEEVFVREIAFVRAMKAKSPTVDVEVQALRIGDAALVSNSTEFFCALGLSIKHDSPWHPTMVAELANGCDGYCPTAEAFKGGGYETRTARSSFLAPGTGEQIVEVSGRLLQRLAAK